MDTENNTCNTHNTGAGVRSSVARQVKLDENVFPNVIVQSGHSCKIKVENMQIYNAQDFNIIQVHAFKSLKIAFTHANPSVGPPTEPNI